MQALQADRVDRVIGVAEAQELSFAEDRLDAAILAGGCNKDVAPTIATDDLQVDAALDAEVAPAIRRPVGGPRTCQWAYEGFARCRLCPYKIPCAGNHDLKAQKVLWGHYHRHHPGQTHTGKAKGPWASLVTPLSDAQEVAWRCKFCSWGISLEASTSAGPARLLRDRREHRRVAHPHIPLKLWRKKDYSDRVHARTRTHIKNGDERAQALAAQGDFTLFRWPRGNRRKNSHPRLPFSFLLSWFCNRCGVPCNKAQLAKHSTKCPRSRARFFAASRLKNLKRTEAEYKAVAPKGATRNIHLDIFKHTKALFQKAQMRASSPCF